MSIRQLQLVSSRATLVILTLSAVFATTQGSAQQPTSADPDVDRYVSDFSSLYPDQAACDAERTYIVQHLETVGQLRGTGRRSAIALANEMDAISDLRTRAAKMAIYGALVSSIDTRSEAAQTQIVVGNQLEAQVEAAVTFLGSDVEALGETQLLRWMAQEPRLAKHRVRIMRILREAPHALPDEQQSMLASMARWPEVSYDEYWALQDSDLIWPTMKNSAGKDVVINVYTYKAEFQGEDRPKAAKALLGRMRSLENAFGVLYTRRLEADLTIARYRKFDDGVDAMWFLCDGMPQRSHRVMIDAARANFATLRRYMTLRSRALHRNQVNYADLYIDPPAANGRFPLSEAMKTAIDVAEPMGPDFQQLMRQGMAANWMHLPPWPQKRGTYAVYYPIGGAPPYFYMSYRDDYTSYRTFVGAAFRMAAKSDIPHNGLPDTRDDHPIYGNGCIEAVRMLFGDYLTEHAATKREKIDNLLYSIDDATIQGFFRWALFAELDGKVEQLIKDGRTPTGSQISARYLDLLHDYYGQGQGGTVVDEDFAGEWMTLSSVPFENYEHQFWQRQRLWGRGSRKGCTQATPTRAERCMAPMDQAIVTKATTCSARSAST